ncbi:methyl-accepting chemotaxis protein [Paenibacillus sp. RUD330]|uniref:methyl-accepting chemotaxis protein n=2 Tax=Paenibacillus TaxID=44249 RepID=UPI000955D9C0|nr:methyl-accepting chemotaxis protein [Paenibacillus sp. RUD330]ASS64818.1 methyl-accepting chemotaxis protein [Paenibacillus sp. RUD330]SIR05022.1 methyl-accepting chemotaxis protein [Paenibacillus sp. RU4X]SIR30309.1 methyl-accepting chemotaxis protein [Paenibacillus sp. RU4T]
MKKISAVARSMKMKLAASFLFIALFFLAAVLYQDGMQGGVRNSMTQLKTEMEKRITTAKINQFLQEMNAAESQLKQTSDTDTAKPFGTMSAALRKELDKLSFPEGGTAAEDLANLRRKVGEYEKDFAGMVEALDDPDMDPLAVLDKVDQLHTKASAESQNMLDITSRLGAAADRNARSAQERSFELLSQTSDAALYGLGIVLLFTVVVAFFLIRSFASSVSRLQKAVAALAAGDLRVRIDSRRRDELGELSRHFDDMVSKVRSMLGQTRGVAASMTDYSESFRSSAGVTAKANEDILVSIGEISAGAQQQSGLSEHSALLIGRLEHELDEMLEAMDAVMSAREQSGADIGSGLSAMGELGGSAKRSGESIEGMYRQLDTLSRQSEEITGVTRLIAQISAQTQILALNASIEAAQAGVHGRGFAVIAEEVRQLASQTKQSTFHIGGLIERLQEGMASFRESMLETKRGLDEQEGQVAVTLDAFESISRSMEGIGTRIHHVHGQVQRTRSSNEELADAVRSVAAIAGQTAAGVERMSALSTEQHEAIRGIAGQAGDIHDLSGRLFGEISVFVLEDEDSHARS